MMKVKLKPLMRRRKALFIRTTEQTRQLKQLLNLHKLLKVPNKIRLKPHKWNGWGNGNLK